MTQVEKKPVPEVREYQIRDAIRKLQGWRNRVEISEKLWLTEVVAVEVLERLQVLSLDRPTTLREGMNTQRK